MITVVCSDRGQHPERRIDLDVAAELNERIGPLATLSEHEKTPRRPDGGITRHFRCRTCGRHVEMREEMWAALVEDLDSVGVSRLDISALPF